MFFGSFEPFTVPDHPMRQVGANIPNEWLIYIFMFIPIIIFLYGFVRHVMVWRLAKGELHRNDKIGHRILSLLGLSLGQTKTVKKPVPGWAHFFLFWGFLLLFMAAGVDASHNMIGWPHLEGALYIGMSWIVDVLGMLGLIGVLVLAAIRYIQKPERFSDHRASDGWLLLLIIVILFTGYVLEGLRIHSQIFLANGPAGIAFEKTASPFGWLFAMMFSGMSVDSAMIWHRILWWFHMALAFTFIAIIPFTKLWHIFGSMINYFAIDMGPSACRMVYNIEEAESFGVQAIEEFTWKDLADLDACTRCGRCQENCPAYLTGKALNPKITLIQAMKKHLDEKAPYLLELKAKQKAGEDVSESTVAMTEEAPNPMEQSLIYDVVTTDVIWDCTNCRACMVHCPMTIEHIPKIIEMRRNLVMWQGDMPGEAQAAFTNMERNYNPWGVGWANRAEWLKERKVADKVKLMSEDSDVEYLLYGGCAMAFDDRYKKVGEAFVNILDQAGISFGYLGTEEQCCGDSARRLGNEYLYQTLAATNIETFNNYGVKKIITLCPHCYNALKNEYPQMGGNYEVYHYTEFLAKLIAEGKLKVKNTVNTRLTYHDSCFLGRHNGIYQEPRSVIKATGANLVEMGRHHEYAFCCGAGGGRMWLEEHAAEGYKRINDTRTDMALATNPEMIITNCPFCLTMLTDGVKGVDPDSPIKVLDLAELLWQSLQ